VRYVFESGPWYRLRFATGSPTTYPSEGDEIVLANVNLVVLAKLVGGTTLPPEGEIAKFSFQCDASWFPVDHRMRELLSLLGEALPAGGEPFDWDRLRGREVLVRFAPPPRPGARNPLLDVRMPPPTDTQALPREPAGAVATSSVHHDPCLPDPVAPSGPAAGSETGLHGRTAVPSDQAPVGAGGRARKLLRGWPEICNALERRCTAQEKRSLKLLNQSQGGPIKHFGRGRLPEAFEEELLAWWNDQEGRHRELLERDASRKHSLDRPMRYGRRGEEIFPDLSMHLKRRRQGPSGPTDNDQL
jgi:hypothetical protein